MKDSRGAFVNDMPLHSWSEHITAHGQWYSFRFPRFLRRNGLTSGDAVAVSCDLSQESIPRDVGVWDGPVLALSYVITDEAGKVVRTLNTSPDIGLLTVSPWLVCP